MSDGGCLRQRGEDVRREEFLNFRFSIFLGCRMWGKGFAEGKGSG